MQTCTILEFQSATFSLFYTLYLELIITSNTLFSFNIFKDHRKFDKDAVVK